MQFPSALWLYMTPQYPRSSAHQIVTGMFQYDGQDTLNGFDYSFGSTIAVLAQDDKVTSECFGLVETPQALLRAEIYEFLLDFFGLDSESKLGCQAIEPQAGGAGDVASFWDIGGAP